MGSNLGSPVAAFFRETRFFALAVVIFVILLVHLDENKKPKFDPIFSKLFTILFSLLNLDWFPKSVSYWKYEIVMVEFCK